MVIIIGTMHKKASQIVLILGPGNELVKEWIKILFCLVHIYVYISRPRPRGTDR